MKPELEATILNGTPCGHRPAFFGPERDAAPRGHDHRRGRCCCWPARAAARRPCLSTASRTSSRSAKASDSNEIPDYVTDEDVEFLEAVSPDGRRGYEASRAEALSALHPAAPWSIIAITFTNKAANELKERLERMLGPEALDVWAMTFHSACCRISAAGHRPAGGLLVQLHDLRLRRTLSASSRTCCAIFRWMKRHSRRGWPSPSSAGPRTRCSPRRSLTRQPPSRAITAWRRSLRSTPSIRSGCTRRTRWTLTTSF